MSLKAKFKTDSALVRGGVWFDVVTNSDGSKCRVKLRRSGRGNPEWQIAFREHTKDRDMDTVSPDEDEVITAKIFAQANLVEWEHFQPEDDGKDLEFTLDNAIKVLSDPDWVVLLNDWQNKSNSIEPYQAEKREREAKN